MADTDDKKVAGAAQGPQTSKNPAMMTSEEVQRRAIEVEVNEFAKEMANNPEYQKLPDDQKHRAIAAKRLILQLGIDLPPAVKDILIKGYAKQADKKVDTQAKIPNDMIDLMSKAAEMGIGLQSKNADHYLNNWYSNQQIAAQKYFSQATSVQDMMVGAAGLGAMLGVFANMLGFHKEGQQLIGYAKLIQADAMENTLDQKKFMEQMAFAPTPDQLNKANIGQANAVLKKGVQADVAPLDGFARVAPDYLDGEALRRGSRDQLGTNMQGDKAAMPKGGFNTDQFYGGGGYTPRVYNNSRGTNGFVLEPYTDKQISAKAKLAANPPEKYRAAMWEASQKYAPGNPQAMMRELGMRMTMESDGHEVHPSGPRKGKVLKSNQGALGLMQIMPGTADDLGVDPANPNQSIDGAARLIASAAARAPEKDSRRFVALEYYGGPAENGRQGKNTHTYADNDALVYQNAFGNAPALKKSDLNMDAVYAANKKAKDVKLAQTEQQQKEQPAQAAKPAAESKQQPAPAKQPTPAAGKPGSKPPVTKAGAEDHIELDTQVAATETRNVIDTVRDRARDTERQVFAVLTKAMSGEVISRDENDHKAQKDFSLAVHAPKPAETSGERGLNQRAEVHARAEPTEGTDKKDTGPKPVVGPLAVFRPAQSFDYTMQG